MKIIAIFHALLAATISDPVVKTWTFPELAFATGNYSGRKTPEEMEYLEDAKYEMASNVASTNETVSIVIPSPSGRSTWLVQELEDQSPRPLIEFLNVSTIRSSEEAREFAKGHAISLAYNEFLESARMSRPQKTFQVKEPGVDISKWSIKDLKEGLRNLKTHPGLRPYLQDAFPALMEYIRKGYRNESIVLVTPLGLIPHAHNLHVKRKTTRKPITTTTRKSTTRYPKGWGVRL